DGDLTKWSSQGVLLLNRVLTVTAGDSASHSHLGWQTVTETIVQHCAEKGAVGLMWGNSARELAPLFSADKRVEGVHPSPLSAHRGFLGSKPFSTVNAILEASGLPRLSFGDSNKLRVGEWVVAIGSPFGLDSTVTAGIVSAKGRETGEYLPFIQTDVAVNPGNSGGPLLNLRGEVVGINSMIYSRTGGFMGISFAIPIDEAQRVYEQLRSSGRVIRGRMGVGIAEVSKEVAEALGLPKAAGALVRNVERGSPAERAGLEAGDIILRYEGKPIERSSDLPRLVGGTKPGTKANLGIWRKGVAKDLVVTVAEAEPDRTAKASAPRANPSAAPTNFLGLVVSDLSEERRNQLRLRGGVQVDAADGPAARAGIQAGDLILSINNQDIVNLAQFNDLVAKLDRNRAVVALVRRGDSAQFVPIRPGR
ncbi:MAG: PDZ domain-containing protein, partial [Betaproteobacteria bacterium]|nr:PDZ domain-containing protein [Betaproteobacteria bacterium]